MARDTVGPYTLERLIGRGGMGEVYEATDAESGETVALKLIRADLEVDRELRLRFEREIAAASRVDSPFVSRVLDADIASDRPYLVTEFVDGPSLTDYVRPTAHSTKMRSGPSPPDFSKPSNRSTQPRSSIAT